MDTRFYVYVGEPKLQKVWVKCYLCGKDTEVHGGLSAHRASCSSCADAEAARIADRTAFMRRLLPKSLR